MLAVDAGRKGLELTCLVALEAPVRLRGDPVRLRQVVANLAANAIKFTSQGEVRIRVRVEQEDAAWATLQFAFADTGIGIPADRIEAVFSAFEQADGSMTRKYGGTGLGLAICKQVMALMGGQIGVESEVGKGSTFHFTVALRKQPGNRVLNSEAHARLQGVKVLVADDSAANQLVVGSLLRSWGCRSSEAVDGTSALAALHQAARMADPFQIALLDSVMPGPETVELANQIRADSELRRTLLVAMTPPGLVDQKICSDKFGFAAAVSKPVMETRLRLALDAALRRPGQARETAGDRGGEGTGAAPASAAFRILLVEDNATSQEVALAMLSKLGYRADGVSDGVEALHALEKAAYDLVFMDCEMPRMNGYEASREIREQERAAGRTAIPIVGLTAHAMGGDRSKCLAAGMSDYLSKPIERTHLAEILTEWLARADRETKAIAKTSDIFDEGDLLRRLLGDRELVRRILAGFLDSVPGQLRALAGYLGEKDASGARLQSHALKGAAATISAGALREAVREIEEAATADDVNLAGVRLARARENSSG